jgi:hypothetical protein
LTVPTSLQPIGVLGFALTIGFPPTVGFFAWGALSDGCTTNRDYCKC